MEVQQTWGRTPEQRQELAEKARAWTGTQREFAVAHGISQSFVCRLLQLAPAPSRPATRDLRPEVIARYEAGEGSQRQVADAMGLSRGMVAKWLSDEAALRGCSLAPRPPRPSAPAPTMLEVVPVATPARACPVEPPTPGTVCLALPGGAELRLDALPPARWVAELAAELARC